VRLGHGKLIDSMVWDGLWDIYNDFHMGITGGEGGREVRDHARDAGRVRGRRATSRAAEATGRRAPERRAFAVAIPQRKGEPLQFNTDEGIKQRHDGRGHRQAQAGLQADGGTVTAANASSINDGASAVVVMSAERAKKLGLQAAARVLSYATGGCAPEWVMMAPEVSIKGVAAKLGMQAEPDFDLHEINEAFSSAALALMQACSSSTRRRSTSTAARWRSVTRSAASGCARAHDAAARDEAARQREAWHGVPVLGRRQCGLDGRGGAVAMAVIGAGTMGNGIAHVFAKAGYDVTLIDISAAALEKGLAAIRKNLEREVAKEKISAEDSAAAWPASWPPQP
jgi:acetyl-CoA acetyltransferase